MYQSIHDKLLTLPDETEIFPAHGAGSLCGRQMSSESSSTIGKQRQSNYALLAQSSEEFVRLLTDNLPARPEYFAREVDLNRRGAAPLSELPPLARVDGAGSSAVAEGGRRGGGHAARDAVRRGARARVGSYRPDRTVRFMGGANSWAGYAVDHRRRRSRTRTRVAAPPGPRREWRMWPDIWRRAWPGGSRTASSSIIFPKSRLRISSNCGSRNRTGSPFWTCVRPGELSGGVIEQVGAHPAGTIEVADGRTGPRATSGGVLPGRLSQFDRHQRAAARRLSRYRQPDRRVRRLENRRPSVLRLIGFQDAVRLIDLAAASAW